MTLKEFSTQFDTLYNNIMSNQAPGLNEYEKSVFLTKAQDQILKNYFTSNNTIKSGFDTGIKRQYDFSNLISEGEMKFIPCHWEEKFDPRSLVYIYPEDCFLVLNEHLFRNYKNNPQYKLTDYLYLNDTDTEQLELLFEDYKADGINPSLKDIIKTKLLISLENDMTKDLNTNKAAIYTDQTEENNDNYCRIIIEGTTPLESLRTLEFIKYKDNDNLDSEHLDEIEKTIEFSLQSPLPQVIQEEGDMTTYYECYIHSIRSCDINFKVELLTEDIDIPSTEGVLINSTIDGTTSLKFKITFNPFTLGEYLDHLLFYCTIKKVPYIRYNGEIIVNPDEEIVSLPFIFKIDLHGSYEELPQEESEGENNEESESIKEKDLKKYISPKNDNDKELIYDTRLITPIYTVVPINLQEYNRLMARPYKYPLKYQVWRLIISKTYKTFEVGLHNPLAKANTQQQAVLSLLNGVNAGIDENFSSNLTSKYMGRSMQNGGNNKAHGQTEQWVLASSNETAQGILDIIE